MVPKLTLLVALTVFQTGLNAFEGVQGIWVKNSEWVDTRTPKLFAESAIEIDGNSAGTEQDKALSIYYWLLRLCGHGGSSRPGPKGQEFDFYDGWANVHVNPKFWCTLWASVVGDIWNAYKNSPTAAEFVHVADGGHAETAVSYRDTDGVVRKHLLDGHLGYFTYNRAGTRLASVDEIRADFSLIDSPSVAVRPYFFGAAGPDLQSVRNNPDYSYVTNNGLTYSFLEYKTMWRNTYNTGFSLRKGESLRRQWYHDKKAVFSAADASYGVDVWYDRNGYTYATNGQPKDPRNHFAQLAYFQNNRRDLGNGYHVYTPELTGGKFAEGAKSHSGLVSGDPAAGEPALRASATGTEGNVIYEIRNIYPYCESFIEGSYLLKSAGTIKVDFSIDSGATWSIVGSYSTVSAAPQTFSIDVGKKRWDTGLKTTFNMACRPSGSPGTAPAYFGYRYLVRASILASGDARDVGLSSLTFKNTLQLNLYSLPTLLPGLNTVTVEGSGLTPGCAVKVTYQWQTGPAGNPVPHTRTEYALMLPHSFVIDIPKQYNNAYDTVFTKCRYIETSVVDAAEATAAEDGQAMAGQMTASALHAFPNPLTGDGTVALTTSFGAKGELAVYDHRGRRIQTLVHSGSRSVWNGTDLRGRAVANGVYIARLRTGGKTLSNKIVVQK